MLLKNLWNYFLGYVLIRLEGPRQESFLNLAMTRGVDLWDVFQDPQGQLWLKVSLNSIKPLRHIARISGCRFKIVSRHGFPFVSHRAWQRKGLVAGTVLFAVALYWLSSFIWFVQVSSNKPLKLLNEEKILSEAARLGVKPGSWKRSLDLDAIEEQLELRLPETTFINIDLQGTLATIEVVEKTLSDHAGQNPAHIVAAKDGIIEEILVLVGEPRVSPGDTVQKGQMLISGLVFPQKILEGGEEEQEQEFVAGEPQKVHARGIVRARVWYEQVVEVPLVETGLVPTGRKSQQIRIKFGDKEIVIKGPRSIPYERYEQEREIRIINFWRNFYTPVEVIQDTYYEMKYYRRELGQEGALQKAKEEAIAQLSKELSKEGRILDQKLEILESPPGTVKVRAWVETMEDIGESQTF